MINKYKSQLEENRMSAGRLAQKKKETTNSVTATSSANKAQAPTKDISSSSMYQQYNQQLKDLTSKKDSLVSTSPTYTNDLASYQDQINQVGNALSEYKNQISSLESAKSQSYVSQQNAQNNVEAYLNALGLANQGVSETTLLRNQNAYTNARANAEASANSNISKSAQQYRSAIENAELTRATQNEATLKQAQADKATLYDSLFATAEESGNISKMEQYLGEIEEMFNNKEITPNDYKRYQEYYEGYQKAQEMSSLGIEDTQAVNDTTLLSVSALDNKKHVSKLLNNLDKLVATKAITNGTVVNMNYGVGDAQNFVYYDGKWYSTKAPRTTNIKDLLKLIK